MNIHTLCYNNVTCIRVLHTIIASLVYCVNYTFIHYEFINLVFVYVCKLSVCMY